MQSCTTVAEAPQKAAAAADRVGGPPFVGVLRKRYMYRVETRCEIIVVWIVVADIYHKNSSDKSLPWWIHISKNMQHAMGCKQQQRKQHPGRGVLSLSIARHVDMSVHCIHESSKFAHLLF